MTQPGSPASAMPADESSVMRRLADLEREMRELRPSIADSFNSTVAEIALTLANQSYPSVASGGASGFSLNTTYSNVINVSVAVPDGYTRALVYASGVVTGANNAAANATRLYTRMVIGGVVGFQANSPMMFADPWASSPAFASTSLTGLSGSISVAIQGRIQVGTSDGDLIAATNATLTVQALFLR